MKTYLAVACLSIATVYTASILKQAQASCENPVYLNASTNVWRTHTLYPNPIYRNQVLKFTAEIPDANLKKKALKVADTGTFVWMRVLRTTNKFRELTYHREGREQIERIEQVAKDVPCNQIVGLVLSGLPYKTCGFRNPLPEKEPWAYDEEYINSIARVLKAFSKTAFAVVIEPAVLAEIVTNSDTSSCKQVARWFREHVSYALRALDLPNVITYLDAAHGGWLGWNDNIVPGAEELANVWRSAGKLGQFRGISTNVGSYNAWNLTPGERFKYDEIDGHLNKARNEQLYLSIIGKEIRARGMPFHAIVDTSRAGRQGIREEWGDWCNVNGAGFGEAPSADTGDESVDAFVWAKWGGESDGTSDTSAIHYDSFCGKKDAFRPMPEKGGWSLEYFVMLLKNGKYLMQG